MSMEETPAKHRAITDVDRKLVFSFLKMLREVEVKEADQLDMCTQMLGDLFSVDPSGAGGKDDAGIDIHEVFAKELSKASSGNPGDFMKDEKFIAFLDLLKKKGYFGDHQEGGEEYNKRLQKAYEKYVAKNNPYEGLTADQLKSKGNELMQASKYKEAIGYYTKAIEVEPTNHIFYCNRAAANTHLKDYRAAVIDCEKTISIKPDFSKGYSRLGTALYCEGHYQRAVDAFTRAVQLEPENESYKTGLEQAKEKVSLVGATSSGGAGGAGGMPGMPGMFPGMGGPGGPDMSQMMQMMQNPQFMQMATQAMQNPQFSSMISNFASSMQNGGGAQSPEDMMRMMQGMMPGAGAPGGGQRIDKDGNLITPMGKINKKKLEEMQNEEVAKDPKFRGIMESVRTQGMGVFQQHMQDPDVMNLMMKFMGMMEPLTEEDREGLMGAGGGAGGGDGAGKALPE